MFISSKKIFLFHFLYLLASNYLCVRD
jgi:hypothetical protein